MEKYVHRCVIQDGDCAGSEYQQEVSQWDYEYREQCPECADRLVTGRQLLAHIYGQLTADGE